MVHSVVISEKHLKATLAICECCVQGKMQHTPLLKSSSLKTEVLNLMYLDLWEPSHIKSLSRKFYFISFTDDASHYLWIYYLHKKSEAFEAFKTWHKEVEYQTGRKLRIFHFDNGGEYITHQWELYMKEHGMVHQKLTPCTLEQNSVSEHLNLTLMDHI